jgi:hypothetical protein
MEPGQLKRGKEFEEEVYARWLERSEAKVEHKVHLVRGKGSGNRGQADLLIRLDIPILDPLQGTRMSRHAVIVEIKATNWDTVQVRRIREYARGHAIQLWSYFDAIFRTGSIETETFDSYQLCIVYPNVPRRRGARTLLETMCSSWGFEIEWFYDDCHVNWFDQPRFSEPGLGDPKCKDDLSGYVGTLDLTAALREQWDLVRHSRPD